MIPQAVAVDQSMSLSLYVHMPWCVKKCPYCDFNSHQSVAPIDFDGYIEALIMDLKAQLSLVAGRAVRTIFFGGGTPSLFKGGHYRRLLEIIRQLLPVTSDVEVTLEANPGTVEHDLFESYAQAGINRISLGIQSFNDQCLHKLGRIHDVEQASNAIQAVKQAGFNNFNIDLMHGLPGQTVDMAMADLRQAIEFEPSHLSWYQLTIEPNTYFYKRRPVLPCDEMLYEIEEQGLRLLTSAGFRRYEISAYCKKEHECQHNLTYWQFDDYLGVGAGAHSKITTVDGETIRFEKHRLPAKYVMQPARRLNQRSVAAKELVFEYMLMCSRLFQPISKVAFEHKTGFAVEHFERQWHEAKQKELLKENSDTYCLTSKGHQYLNEFQLLFMS